MKNRLIFPIASNHPIYLRMFSIIILLFSIVFPTTSRAYNIFSPQLSFVIQQINSQSHKINNSFINNNNQGYLIMILILFLIIVTITLYTIRIHIKLRRVTHTNNHIHKETIASHRKTKQSLQESEQRYRIVASQKGQIVYDYNLDTGQVLWFGDIENTLGFTAPQYQKNDVNQWINNIHPDDQERIKTSLQHAINKGIDYTDRYRYKKKDSTYITIEENGTFLKTDKKTPYRMLGIMRDITKQIEIEDQLREQKEKAQRTDKFKTQFLANMSHEVRTPLNGILGFISLIRSSEPNAEKQEKYFSVIEQSSNHLKKIIDDILDISLIESGKLKINKNHILLNPIIRSLKTHYQRHEKIKDGKVSLIYHMAFPDGQDTFYTDEVRLKQILINLINNALKFTQEGNINVSYSQMDNNMLLFKVSDTGIGIPKERINTIFERFRQIKNPLQTHKEGVGLGLSISQGLVDCMGGKIWCESKVDQGTSIMFSLPLSKSHS